MHFNAIIRKNSQKYLRGRGSVEQKFAVACVGQTGSINLLAPELFFFLNLAHSVYKMWITQETNTLELWNKLYFEEKKTENIYHV